MPSTEELNSARLKIFQEISLSNFEEQVLILSFTRQLNFRTRVWNFGTFVAHCINIEQVLHLKRDMGHCIKPRNLLK